MLRIAMTALLVVGFASIARAQPNDATASGADTAPVVTPTIATVATETIETPFVGTFDLSGPGGFKGTLTIGRKDDTLKLSGTAGGSPLSLSASVKKAHSWQLPLGSDSTGLVHAINGHNAAPVNGARVLVVSDAGQGKLTGSLTTDGHKTADVTLTRRKEALVVYGTYMGGMHVFATQCAEYYKAKGYIIREIPGDWIEIVKALVLAEETGHTFTRVVMVSHGGWDGPMFEGQYCQISNSGSPDYPEGFFNYIQALRRGTTLDAKYIYSCCHQGGSDRFEGTDATDPTSYRNYRITDDIAKRTGRTAVGPQGETSTEWSKLLCMFAEGEGPARQESRISTASGGRTFQQGQFAK